MEQQSLPVSPSNGRIDEHGHRLESLEQSVTKLSVAVAETNVKLDHINIALDRLHTSIDDLSHSTNIQSERIGRLEVKENQRALRRGVIRKTIVAAMIAGVGAMIPRLATFLLAKLP